ncbi:MAG: winged helix-turn-helix transcriptional regulator [Catenulispora sp.]|nr:winged helix-turn-helix transcriptional regulator [Catenulispora sp.]
MTLRIDITGLPPDRVRFAASPLAELASMLHGLAATDHHPELATWATTVRAALPPELTERLQEAEFLWRSSRADFLVPAHPRRTLREELDDVDHLDDETYVTSALITTCGSNRLTFPGRSPLADPAARDRALDLAQARGAAQEAFAERLLADPSAVRARVRQTLEWCAEAFFDAAWPTALPQINTDIRHKTDLRERQGLAAALAAVSSMVRLEPNGNAIVLDKLQDNTTTARDAGVTFIPSLYGHPHLVAVHAAGWHPVVQYPVARDASPQAVPLDTMQLRLEALAHPVRLRLVRTLARGPHTTSELAHAWDLTAPEVSRHLAALRRAGLLTTERRGRYVHYQLDLSATTSLGTDLLAAVLR